MTGDMDQRIERLETAVKVLKKVLSEVVRHIEEQEDGRGPRHSFSPFLSMDLDQIDIE